MQFHSQQDFVGLQRLNNGAKGRKSGEEEGEGKGVVIQFYSTLNQQIQKITFLTTKFFKNNPHKIKKRVEH